MVNNPTVRLSKYPDGVEIPFNLPSIVGDEFKNIAECIANGKTSGDGVFTQKCSRLLENVLGVRKALLTTSCTDALEMAALLLNILPGDEVIVPSFTFVSTVNAFVLRGARPVFVDIRPDTLNMDENRLARLITEKTKAIVPVHYAGVSCDLDQINKIASAHGVAVVEDNAHGLMGRYKGKYLGSFGSLATLSFHETKNFHCGEGGALLINDESYVQRAEIIREKGTNRSRFFRGQVDKYTWVDIGSSFLPSDMLAAFLLAQLEKHVYIQTRRREIWNHYFDNLQDWCCEHSVKLPYVPDDCDQAYHMFYLLLPSLEARQAVISHLRQKGILSVYHYLPLHLSDMGIQFGGLKANCPVTEDISDRIVRLPFHLGLTEPEQDRVIAELRRIKFD